MQFREQSRTFQRSYINLWLYIFFNYYYYIAFILHLQNILSWPQPCNILSKSHINLSNFILRILKKSPSFHPAKRAEGTLNGNLQLLYLRYKAHHLNSVSWILVHLLQLSQDFYDNDTNNCSLNTVAAQRAYPCFKW